MPTNERLSIIDQAENVVNTTEAKYVTLLFQWEMNAQHRAENCKCPQCKGEVKRAASALSRELNRLSPEYDEEQESEPSWQ